MLSSEVLESRQLLSAIAVQDFNILSAAGTTNLDSFTAGTSNNPLTNSGSQNTNSANGLTFATFWTDTRGNQGPRALDLGADASDFVGVNSFGGANSPNVGPTGTSVAAGIEHNFEFNDGDGRLDLIFDPVDVSVGGLTNRTLSLNYWIATAGTGYETGDSLRITISDGVSTYTAIDFDDAELEANASPDDGTANWKKLTVDLEDLIANQGFGESLTVKVSVDTNAGDENIFLDNVSFQGVEVTAANASRDLFAQGKIRQNGDNKLADYYGSGNDDAFAEYGIASFRFTKADFGLSGGDTITDITQSVLTLTYNDRTFTDGNAVEFFLTTDEFNGNFGSTTLPTLTFDQTLVNGIKSSQYTHVPVSLGVFPFDPNPALGGTEVSYVLDFTSVKALVIDKLNTSGEFNILIGATNSTHDITFSGLNNTFDPGNPNLALEVLAISGVDSTPPVLLSLNPSDNAINAASNGNLEATFDEVVQAGSGNVVIYRSSDHSVVESLPVDGAQVSFAGTKLIANPVSDLDDETEYYVKIDAGAVQDLAGNDFVGINDTTTWNFITEKGPTLRIGNVSVDESAGTAVFTVVLSEPVSRTVTVKYATQDRTAVAGQDYTSTSGTLTIPAGKRSATISVDILPDGLTEGTETFEIVLSEPVGARPLTVSVTGLTGSVAPGSRPQGSPFALAPQFAQSVVVSRNVTGNPVGNSDSDVLDNLDMNTLNETGPDAGRYLFTSSETGANAGVVRTDLVTGESVTLVRRSDFERFDGIRWTPWGTLLVAEETTAAEERDPIAQPDPTLETNEVFPYPTTSHNRYSGLVYEITNPLADPAAIHIVARPALGSLSHEGMDVDSAGNLYMIDEFATGSIYRFTPDAPGDLSSGQLFVLKVASGTTGAGTWVRIDNLTTDITDSQGGTKSIGVTVNARAIAQTVGATTYNRPEDIEIEGDILYLPITDEHRVLAIDLHDAAVPVVHDFVTRLTTDEATGNAAGTEFGTPDNVTVDADGNLWITEDGNGNDLWIAVDTNSDQVADVISRVASLATAGSEPTGIYANPFDPNELFVNVQHATSDDDAIIRLTRLGGTTTAEGRISDPTAKVRFATFNASLNRTAAGQLISDLSTPNNAQAKQIAEIIQRANADVILINEFDFDELGANGGSLAAELFQQNYLSISQNGAAPVTYQYTFIAPSNTGIASGLDFDNNGTIGGGNDAYGFGDFEGQYGMLLLSKYEIVADDVRTFQNFLWKDMPGAMLPADPNDADGNGDTAHWYTPAELDAFRLSSKSHWDVPISVDGQIIHVLAAHPTPPVFDGPEDRNGTRNHDEIRFWSDYIMPGAADYIYDDAEFAAAGNTTPVAPSGGLAPGASFVILGDYNADPFDGDSVASAAQQFIYHPRINNSVAPDSAGGPVDSAIDGGVNNAHFGHPAFDTSDFSEPPGNLRVDYALPSADLKILDANVYWPAESTLVNATDHRLTYVDIQRQAMAPTEIALSNDSIAENSPVGTVVGTLSGTDPNTNDTLTFSLPDDAGGRFAISGNQLVVNGPLDYEAAASHAIVVRVTDSTNRHLDVGFTIAVTNVFEIASFDVQNGQTQRSFVRNVDLVFADFESLQTLLDGNRVQLKYLGANGTGNTALNLSGKIQAVGNQLKFDAGAGGIGGNRNSNVGDGFYAFQFDLDGDGTFETTRKFYRLFGDLNGDRQTTAADQNLVPSAPVATYNPESDVNGDGVVDARDRIAIRLGRQLTNSVSVDD